jgi:hypothetical protein
MKRTFDENIKEINNFNNKFYGPDVVIPKRFLENFINDVNEERKEMIEDNNKLLDALISSEEIIDEMQKLPSVNRKLRIENLIGNMKNKYFSKQPKRLEML